MKWGILATGNIANKFAKTVGEMGSEEEVVAVGSRNLESAETFASAYGIKYAFQSYQEVCDCPQVEAVYISTPNNMHYQNARMCLESGKHVLCEKPFTINYREAEDLYQLAESKGLFIMEAFWIRFLPLLTEMRRVIDSGTIGEIKHMRCDYGFCTQGARKDRKFDSSLGGGALLDVGIYNLGFAHMVMQSPPICFTSNVSINEYGTDDYSAVMLEYPGERTAAVTTAIGMELPREAMIAGTKGSIFLPDYQHAETMMVRPYGQEPYEVKRPFEINGFEYQIREVSRCVAAGLSSSPVYTKEDSVTIIRLMEDIRRSWNMKFSFEV